MTKVQQSTEQLETALKNQIQFLKNSAASFDIGYLDEAVRMATSMRILFHQTRSSHPLLGQLGKLKSLYYADTAGVFDPGDLLPTHNLVALRSDGVYQAPLDFSRQKPTFSTFDKWWDQIVLSNTTMTMSRKTLVVTAANQDGGAHVDPSLDADYHALKSGSPWWVATNEIGDETPVQSVHLHSIRQIAHEAIVSLDPGYSIQFPSGWDKTGKANRKPKN